ncbi:P63C domain-containing protein [Oscillibacter sp.]|uniref:P63C domain-containing protein n=1 Tax=Oscillibacter sp. TaxID=1945593 RepID=UPI0028A132A7|nr:P63C domain-containing protein [Oscillibacter sp.]
MEGFNQAHDPVLPTRDYTGVVSIGGKDLNCAVLSDGTRVFTAKSVFEAFGRPRRGRASGDQRAANMPSFIDANNLKPFSDKAFGCGSEFSMEVKYTSASGRRVYTGYRAEILPLICDVYLSARDAGVLTDSQKPLSVVADILMRSLAKVGIAALIDEATGYQYDRDRDELQRLLSAYISEEFLPWTKRFPDEFYIQMFRLKGWEYKGKAKSPLVGKITNEIVYEQLPQGVLDELKEKTPKDSHSGNRTKRFHQSLTPDTGIPHLDKHIASLIALMRASDTWDGFYKLFCKAYNMDVQLDIGDIPNAKDEDGK